MSRMRPGRRQATTHRDVSSELEEPDQADPPGTVQPPVLATLYEETGDALDQQLDQIDRLNERAQQLFGFSAVILAIIAAVAPKDASTVMKIAFALAIPLFAPAAGYAAWAWRLASWRGDPDMHKLWEQYRKEPEEHFRYQVILNRLDSIRVNEKRIAAKLKKVKRAHFWLYCGFVYIAVLVVFRLVA
jgi:hypothetical protein